MTTTPTIDKPASYPTLEGEFLAGLRSGDYPNTENTHKAFAAMAGRETAPLVRAYWSGYLCKATLPYHNGQEVSIREGRFTREQPSSLP